MWVIYANSNAQENMQAIADNIDISALFVDAESDAMIAFSVHSLLLRFVALMMILSQWQYEIGAYLAVTSPY